MAFRWSNRIARSREVWVSPRLHVSLDYDTANHRSPCIALSRSGRNGSPAGFGPKPWPSIMAPLSRGGFRGYAFVPLPFITWGRAYRLRRFGALRAYKAADRFYRTLTH